MSTSEHSQLLQQFPAISEQQRAQLENYCELLRDWNQRINLVSRKDIERLWPHHIWPSILPLTVVDIPANSKILDIGSGGGLPAIPVKIMRPDLQILMIDSIRKKCFFLKDAIAALELNHITVMNERVEALHTASELIAQFDIVTARAVGPSKRLIDYGRPFLKSPARFILWKGSSDIADLQSTAEEMGFNYTIHTLSSEQQLLSPKLPELRWFDILL